MNKSPPIEKSIVKRETLVGGFSNNVGKANKEDIALQKKYQNELKETIDKIRLMEKTSNSEFVDYADAYKNFYREIFSYLEKNYGTESAYKKSYEFIKLSNRSVRENKYLLDRYYAAVDKMVSLSSQQNRDIIAYKKSREVYKELGKKIKESDHKRIKQIQNFWGNDYYNILVILNRVNNDFNSRNNSYISYNVSISL